jgi:hypothetical protein
MKVPGFKEAYESNKSKTDVSILGGNAEIVLTESALLDLGYVIKPTRLGLYAFTCQKWEDYESALNEWRNLDFDTDEPKPSFTDFGFNIANAYMNNQ